MALSDPTTTAIVPVPFNLSGNATRSHSAQVANIINWVTFSIGLPAIGLAIYTLKNLSKGEIKIPKHVLFLLVSDIVSFFGRPQGYEESTETSATTAPTTNTDFSLNATDFIFYFGVISNVTLMVFIAQERHLLVAYPRCLACCGVIKTSPAVTLLAFAAPFGVLALAILKLNLWFAVSLLAPFPILLFFAVDSWRALICSRSQQKTLERRRSVWGISAIWANYTLLYTPFVLSVLLEELGYKETVVYLGLVSHLLLYLSPLVDPFLYIFMTKGLKEVLRALPCCQKSGSKENEVRESTVDTVAETVETRL